MTPIGESACVPEPSDVGVSISIRFQKILRQRLQVWTYGFSTSCFNLSLAVFRCLLLVFVAHSAGPVLQVGWGISWDRDNCRWAIFDKQNFL